MDTQHSLDMDIPITGGSFSFPGAPVDATSSSLSPSSSSEDFDFGLCVTPESPSGEDFNRGSPADHLFYNGRLLPHSFPLHGPPHRPRTGPSRTSSVGSKDSLFSSRSNSTSSSCSSARTSAAGSDGSERRVFLYGRQGSKSSTAGSVSAGKVVSAQVYGSSMRWRFMAPVPVPDLRRDNSKKKKKKDKKKKKKKKKKNKKRVVVKRSCRFGRKIFRWLVSACRECHAIQPSRKDGVKIK